MIGKLLSRLHSVQRRGRAHAKHQNRLIQNWAISDDFTQSPTDLDRLFLPVTRRHRAKSLTESSDYPSFGQGGTHSRF